MSRIVYRESPEKFRVLRNVDHLHPQYQALNAEYEKWQADFLNKYGQDHPKKKLAWPPPLSPRAKTSLERDAAARKKMFGGTP